MKKNKKRVAVFAFLVVNVLSLHALDFVFKIEPTVMFPNVVQTNMKIAPGVSVQADLDFLNLLTVGAEGGYLFEQPKRLQFRLPVRSRNLSP